MTSTLFVDDHCGLLAISPADWTDAELHEALQIGLPLADTELALRAAMRRLGLRDRKALQPDWWHKATGAVPAPEPRNSSPTEGTNNERVNH